MKNSTFADQLLLLFVQGLIGSDSTETKRKFYSGVRDIRREKQTAPMALLPSQWVSGPDSVHPG